MGKKQRGPVEKELSWSSLSAILIGQAHEQGKEGGKLELFLDEVEKGLTNIPPEIRTKYNVNQDAVPQLKSLQKDKHSEAIGRLASVEIYIGRLNIPESERLAYKIGYLLKART